MIRTAEFVHPAVYRQWYEKLYDGSTSGLERAMERGEVVWGHAGALAYCIGAVSDWSAQRWLLWGDGRPVPDEVMETILGFVLRGIGVVSEPKDEV